MKPPVETVRVSERGREILIKLKRRTGIEHWNELCRWALLVSLAKPQPPDRQQGLIDSNIEIKWNTFGGEHAAIYSLLVSMQHSSTKERHSLSDYFRAHLERGLLLLQQEADLTGMMETALKPRKN